MIDRHTLDSRARLPLFGALLALVGLASAAQADAQPKAGLESGALVVRVAGASAGPSLTAEGAVRFTALADGAMPEPLPSSIELAPGPALTAGDDAFTAGAYTVAVEPGGAVVLAAGGRRLLRVSLGRDGAGLQAALDFDGAKVFHGFGQIAPALALTSEKLLHVVLLFRKDAVPKLLEGKAGRFDPLWMKVTLKLAVGKTRVALR